MVIFDAINKCITIAFTIYFLQMCRSGSANGTIEEYCIWETFMAECPKGEILVINEAKHGRMNVGKCLTEKEVKAHGSQSQDPRFLGCHNDVTGILNSKCAMQNSCEVKIIDLENSENMACLPGLKMFLKVEFSCLTVIGFGDRCHFYMTSRATYFNPKLIDESTCASQGRPLVIESPKGQRIKISLNNLAYYSRTDIIEKNTGTSEIGLITDSKTGSNFTICQNGFKENNDHFRSSKFIVSKENLLSIVIFPDENSLALLTIEAEGCLDIVPPEDTWLKRNHDDIVIGCYSSKQTWYLRCEDRQWKGAIGNCTISTSHEVMDIGREASETDVNKMTPTQQILIIAAICGVGIAACFTIICLGGLCLKKSKESEEIKYFSVHGEIGNSLSKKSFMLQPYQSHYLGQQVNSLPNRMDHVTQSHLSDDVMEERYQILDKEEVAIENVLLA